MANLYTPFAWIHAFVRSSSARLLCFMAFFNTFAIYFAQDIYGEAEPNNAIYDYANVAVSRNDYNFYGSWLTRAVVLKTKL